MLPIAIPSRPGDRSSEEAVLAVLLDRIGNMELAMLIGTMWISAR